MNKYITYISIGVASIVDKIQDDRACFEERRGREYKIKCIQKERGESKTEKNVVGCDGEYQSDIKSGDVSEEDMENQVEWKLMTTVSLPQIIAREDESEEEE